MQPATAKVLTCPNCGWSHVRRSQDMGAGDWIARFTGFRPLRCRKCRLRYYRPWFIASRAAEMSGPVPAAKAPPSWRLYRPRFLVKWLLVKWFLAKRFLARRPQPAADVHVSVPATVVFDTVVSATPAPRWILLLDHDPALRKLLRRLLSKAGHEVREASDTTAAMAELHRAKIDLAIVNLDPTEGGGEIVAAFRNMDPDLWILVLSETGESEDQTGRLLILLKPVRAFAVVQSANTVLAGAPAVSAASAGLTSSRGLI
jgi:CheY-like chemotaxis protein